jgi:hypothetical protein
MDPHANFVDPLVDADAYVQCILDHSKLQYHSGCRNDNLMLLSQSQILTIWGLIGIHTDKFGFKHVWEIWYGAFIYDIKAPR